MQQREDGASQGQRGYSSELSFDLTFCDCPQGLCDGAVIFLKLHNWTCCGIFSPFLDAEVVLLVSLFFAFVVAKKI